MTEEMEQNELPEFPEEEEQDELIEEEAYAELQEQVKTLTSDHIREIFAEMQKDEEFTSKHDMTLVESILGTMNGLIKGFSWDRFARNIEGNPITLVRKYDIPDEEVEDGFKYGLEGVSIDDYNEVFKTEEDRDEAIKEAGVVVYNG